MTILGAMTNQLFYFRLADGTNSQTVGQFFSAMADKHSLSGSVIIMDNHRAHYNKEVLDFTMSQGAELLFLPPATSIMNPIETLWNIIKTKWRKTLLMTDVEVIGQRWMQR